MHEEIFSYDFQLYSHLNSPHLTLGDLDVDSFNQDIGDIAKDLESTGRFNQQLTQSNKPCQQELHTQKEEEQLNTRHVRLTRKIQLKNTPLSSLVKLRKSRIGRPYEIKNITQVMKTETVRYLSMLSDLQILNEQERCQLRKFKQESLSIGSFNNLGLIQNLNEKLIDFFESSQLPRSIISASRLSFERKIQIIRNLGISSKLVGSSKQVSRRKCNT